MAPASKFLLPPASQLVKMSDETAKVIVALADAENRRAHVYSMAGLLCGTFSLLCSFGVDVYLVMHGHDAAAGVVLGTAVLAVIGTLIRGR